MMGPTTVFFNGLVFSGTVDGNNRTTQAQIDHVVAVRDDSIIYIGHKNEEQSRRLLQGKENELVDLKGRSLLPGLTDRSDHFQKLWRQQLTSSKPYASVTFRRFPDPN